MKHIHRRAFSLIDLVGALAVVSLVAAVLVPVLHVNRNGSQGETSRARMKLLIRAHAAYSVSHQDRWLNPFNPTANYNGSVNASDPEWYSARVPSRPGYVWRFNDAGYQTELYALMWASAAKTEILGGNALSPIQFDPRDSQLIGGSQQFTGAPGFPNDYIWAGSYMYSPTMWFHPLRYGGIFRNTPVPPNQLGGTRGVRYNTTADTLFPSQKVVLFARADFDQSMRSAADGQPVSLSPQWNNVVAVPDAAFADGSVDETSIRKLRRSIEAGSSWLVPTTPSWNVSTSLLERYSVGGAGWENGQNNTTAWPAYFWGTRGGIGGRDVPAR